MTRLTGQKKAAPAAFFVSPHNGRPLTCPFLHLHAAVQPRPGSPGLTPDEHHTRLAHPPEMINIGAVVRRMESDFALVECLGNDNTCRILPACSLKPILQDAGERFLDALDVYSLADVLDNRKVLVKLLTDDRRLKIHPVPSDPTSRLK